MQDNGTPHVAGMCQQFLKDEDIDAMDWPMQHLVAPQTLQELADSFALVWEDISQKTILCFSTLILRVMINGNIYGLK